MSPERGSLVGIEIDFGPLPLLKEESGRTSADKSQGPIPSVDKAPVVGQPAPLVERRPFPAPRIPGEFEQREREREPKIFFFPLFSFLSLSVSRSIFTPPPLIPFRTTRGGLDEGLLEFELVFRRVGKAGFRGGSTDELFILLMEPGG